MLWSNLHSKGDATVCSELRKAEVEAGDESGVVIAIQGDIQGGSDQNSTGSVVRSDQIPKCTLHFDISISK